MHSIRIKALVSESAAGQNREITLTLFLFSLFCQFPLKLIRNFSKLVSVVINMSITDIDRLIIENFHLFEGIRTEDEDAKIYNKVLDLSFAETSLFLEENLDPVSFLFMNNALNSDELKQNPEAVIDLVFEYLRVIPDYRVRLNKRIESFIQNLVQTSIN